MDDRLKGNNAEKNSKTLKRYGDDDYDEMMTASKIQQKQQNELSNNKCHRLFCHNRRTAKRRTAVNNKNKKQKQNKTKWRSR